MNAIIQSLIDGIFMGGVYALAALGVSLIFGVMKITNFAHGALLTLGMYITYQIHVFTGANPYIALPVTAAVMFLIGYGIQSFLINKAMKGPSHNQLLLTLGLSIVVSNLILVIWSAGFKIINIKAFSKALSFGGVSVSIPKLDAFLFVMVISAAIILMLSKTDLGKAIRAISAQKEGAALMGIRINRINATAFGIGVLCAGIAGALLTPIQYMSPTLGDKYQLKCFVIAVFGGLGSIGGAYAAGIIIGVVESLTAYLLGGSWSEMVIYVIFILVLMFKPAGLMGKKAT